MNKFRFLLKAVPGLQVALKNELDLPHNLPYHWLSLSQLDRVVTSSIFVDNITLLLKQTQFNNAYEIPYLLQSLALNAHFDYRPQIIIRNERQEVTDNLLIDLAQQFIQKKFKPKPFLQQGSSSALVPSKDRMPLLITVSQRIRFEIPISRQPLHKFGWKKAVGWGPLKESIAADIVKPLVKSGLKLIDPFCGCGTLGLTALAMSGGAVLRRNLQELTYLSSWKLWRSKTFLPSNSLKESDIKVIMGDNSPKAVDSCRQNLKQVGVQKGDSSSFCSHYAGRTEFYGNVIITNLDFEQTLRLRKGQGWALVSNIPWGHRSQAHVNKPQLESLNRRLAAAISNQCHDMSQVKLIVPLSQINNPNSVVCRLKFQLESQYEQGPAKVGCFRLYKPRTLQPVIQNPVKVVPKTNYDLQKRFRELARPLLEKKVQGRYQREKLKKQLAILKSNLKRGIAWKKINQGLLSKYPQLQQKVIPTAKARLQKAANQQQKHQRRVKTLQGKNKIW